MEWIAKATVVASGPDQGVRQVIAGWLHPGRFPGEPARVDGWSIVLNIDSETLGQTHGSMIFPERAAFEFEGGVDKLVRELKKAEGGRAIFAMAGITFWRI